MLSSILFPAPCFQFAARKVIALDFVSAINTFFVRMYFWYWYFHTLRKGRKTVWNVCWCIFLRNNGSGTKRSVAVSIVQIFFKDLETYIFFFFECASVSSNWGGCCSECGIRTCTKTKKFSGEPSHCNILSGCFLFPSFLQLVTVSWIEKNSWSFPSFFSLSSRTKKEWWNEVLFIYGAKIFSIFFLTTGWQFT